MKRLGLRIAPIVLLAGFICVSQLHAAGDSAAPSGKKLKVLFIGNSLTFQNNLPVVLKTIAADAHPAVSIKTEMIAIGGAKLEKHWEKGDAQKKIATGGWDYVVLQDHSGEAIKDLDSMQKHMRLFDAEIKKAHAKTILYMTWALQKSPEDQPAITKAYTDMGKELGAEVIPVGIARQNAAKADPKVALFVKDGKHPTPGGTYLAACVFFKALTGQSPKGVVGKVSDPKTPAKTLVNLTAEEASFFQKIAEETVSAQSVK